MFDGGMILVGEWAITFCAHAREVGVDGHECCSVVLGSLRLVGGIVVVERYRVKCWYQDSPHGNE